MANGTEDLKEKNKSQKKTIRQGKYSEWANFQGKEDAQMLYEKSNNWYSIKTKREWEKDNDLLED